MTTRALSRQRLAFEASTTVTHAVVEVRPPSRRRRRDRWRTPVLVAAPVAVLGAAALSFPTSRREDTP